MFFAATPSTQKKKPRRKEWQYSVFSPFHEKGMTDFASTDLSPHVCKNIEFNLFWVLKIFTFPPDIYCQCQVHKYTSPETSVLYFLNCLINKRGCEIKIVSLIYSLLNCTS